MVSVEPKILRIAAEVILLYKRPEETGEPAAIIQYIKSGDYLYTFQNWKDAVHYVLFEANSKSTEDIYKKWSLLYGYDEEEVFKGNLNDFSNDKYDWIVSVNGMDITPKDDLNTLTLYDLLGRNPYPGEWI